MVFRTGDQGNGVQEAEIVKIFRILIGVDDNQPQRMRIMPRMPYGWNEIAVDKYPVLVEHEGKMETALLRYTLERDRQRMNLKISAEQAIGTGGHAPWTICESATGFGCGSEWKASGGS